MTIMKKEHYIAYLEIAAHAITVIGIGTVCFIGGCMRGEVKGHKEGAELQYKWDRSMWSDIPRITNTVTVTNYVDTVFVLNPMGGFNKYIHVRRSNDTPYYMTEAPVTVTNHVTVTNYETIRQVIVVTNYWPTEPMPYIITNVPVNWHHGYGTNFIQFTNTGKMIEPTKVWYNGELLTVTNSDSFKWLKMMTNR
jgi:hypothetical protein